MKVIFHKNSIKFLEKISEKESALIKSKLKYFIDNFSKSGIIPYKELQIKSLSGNWEGFYRMRVGKIRIIFKIDKNSNTLLIYEIDYRGNIY